MRRRIGTRLSAPATVDMMVSLLPEKTDGPLELMTLKHCAAPAPDAVTFAMRSEEPPFVPTWEGTDADAVRFAAEQEADIAARIEAGEIPPRPEDGTFGAWFVEHLACATPSHRYFVRARGKSFCAACIARAGER